MIDFSLSPEIEDVRLRTKAFVAEHLIPLEADRANYDDHDNIRNDLLEQMRRVRDRRFGVRASAFVDALKRKAGSLYQKDNLSDNETT